MGAPKGNKNGAKQNRLWGDAIRRAVVQSDAEQLRKLADKLIEKAGEGDIAALKELGDRLDGKAVASHEHSGADGGPLTIRWEE